MAKKLDVYMPLMVGDWLKGTRGMRAEVRGVYINLLLFQWDNGYIPSGMDDLSFIDPEVGKVWVFIKDKFNEFERGKLRNEKCEEVRGFFLKQAKNGSKGGRPKNNNPKHNPEVNPNSNPKHNLHNELELEYELKNKKESENFEPEFSDYERWTEDASTGNDPLFTNMLRKLKVQPNGQLPDLVRSHLALLATYPNKKPPDQHRFRIALISHIEKELKNGNNKHSNKSNASGVSSKHFSGKYEESL